MFRLQAPYAPAAGGSFRLHEGFATNEQRIEPACLVKTNAVGFYIKGLIWSSSYDS